MAKNNPSNPYTSDASHTQREVQMPIQKARVVSAKSKDERGFHTVRITVYGDNAPYDAPVLTPIIGSTWVPKEGSDVAVVFGADDKPWVVGSWYAADRVEDGNVDLPSYNPGDLRLGNESGAHVTVEADGDVRIESNSDGDVYIDGVKQ